MFNSIEKVEGTVFVVGNMKLATTIVNGTKSSVGDRLNSIYKKSYKSKKYNDEMMLDQLYINTSDFLVLSYKEYADKTVIGDDIYMSYKQIDLFRNFLDEIEGTFVANADKVYKKNDISKDYSEVFITSEPMIGDKTISAYAAKCETEDRMLYNGVVFVIDSQDDTNCFYQEISLDTFLTMKSIIDNYNLSIEGKLINIQSMLFQLLDGNTSSSSGGSMPSRTSRTPARRPGRSFAEMKARQNKKLHSDTEDEDYDENDEIEVEGNDEEDEAPKKMPTRKSPSKKSPAKSVKTPSKGKKKTIVVNKETSDDDGDDEFSLDSIVASEEDFELDVDESDVEFD